MRTHSIRAALAALSIAALAGAAAPSAIADGGAKTQITIKKLAHSGASGTVSSGKSSCEGGRKVSLFRLDDYVSVKIKITYSNSNGRWRVRKNLKDGRYFAKVDAVKGCRYDVSKNKTL